MLKVARSWKPHVVAHLGDLGDFYAVSAHSKDPSRKLLLKEEMDVARACRQDLDNLNPKRKIFVEGNHEFRLSRYLADKAEALTGYIDTDSALGLTENGWEFTPYREYTNVGKLHLTHDTGQGGKYTAARATETFHASVAIGHHHAMQYFVTGDATGDHQLGVSFGWLGDVSQIDYMHKIKVQQLWSLGFGIGYHQPSTGVVYTVPVPIIDYTCMVEGRLYVQN